MSKVEEDLWDFEDEYWEISSTPPSCRVIGQVPQQQAASDLLKSRVASDDIIIEDQDAVSSSSSFCPPAHDDRAHCKEAKDDRACSESDDDEELSDSDGEESHSLGKDDDEKDCELAGGTFLESTSSIMQTCSCCNKYQKYASASSTSNNRMKDRVFNLSLRELRDRKETMCQLKCTLQCQKFMEPATMMKYRELFWGEESAAPPTAKLRREKIQCELKKAWQKYAAMHRGHENTSPDDKDRTHFMFTIDDKAICEKAYVNILGLADTKGHKSKMWKHEVDKFFGDVEEDVLETISISRRSKRDHAYSYIEDVVRSGKADRSAFEKQENSVYLPYRRLRFFYGEYLFLCQHKKMPMYAKENTFRRAFNEVKSQFAVKGVKVKFNSGKGTFDKCEVCHNAEQLLKRTSIWSKDEIAIIKAYRRQHIQQQFEERIKLQSNIALTYDLDSNGRPKTALLLPDGMTTVTGDTPRIGDRRAKSDTKVITSRIIGVEVHCGPIHGTILYYTDNLTAGGSNIMIEIIRQSILDLKVLLEKQRDKFGNSLDVPDHLILQFDNCSENKNKFVFTYLSLLVQDHHFKVIEVFFLIVGHTHTSIDQYFSVIARIIWKCNFLGSPISLESLLAGEAFENISLSGPSWVNNEEQERKLKSKPLLVRKISVVYDMKKALLSLINTKLKYYSIPHQFRFELYQGVCAMQYKIFSSQETFLPLRPEGHEDIELSPSLDVVVELFSMVGGQTKFIEACGGNNISTGEQNIFSNKNSKSLEVHNLLHKLSKSLEELEAKIIHDCVRTSVEQDDDDQCIKKSKKTLSALDDQLLGSISASLSKRNTAERGLIMWLNPGVSRDINPEPIRLRDTLSYLFANADYVSTGYDAFDIVATLNDSVRYQLIDERLKKVNEAQEESDVNKRLNTTVIESLWGNYFPNDSISGGQTGSNLDSINEIVQVGKKVYSDIIKQRIYATNSLDFDYSSECKLSQQEVIFYYLRMFPKGIYYALFEEFKKELYNKNYSILPLIRPTASNASLTRELERQEASALNRVVEISDNILKTYATSGVGREVMSRPNVDRRTQDAEGVPTLYQPSGHGSAQAAIDLLLGNNPTGAQGEKRKRSDDIAGIEDYDFKALMSKTISDLKAIANKENINLEGKRTKKDIATRINTARQNM